MFQVLLKRSRARESPQADIVFVEHALVSLIYYYNPLFVCFAQSLESLGFTHLSRVLNYRALYLETMHTRDHESKLTTPPVSPNHVGKELTFYLC